MAELFVSFETVWIKEPPNGELCAACKEPIYSDMHVLYLVINDKRIGTCAEVCNSCFELIKKDAV